MRKEQRLEAMLDYLEVNMCVYAMLCETLDRSKRKETQVERGLNLERGLYLELPSPFDEPRSVSLYLNLSSCFAVIKRE